MYNFNITFPSGMRTNGLAESSVEKLEFNADTFWVCMPRHSLRNEYIKVIGTMSAFEGVIFGSLSSGWIFSQSVLSLLFPFPSKISI